MGTTLLRRATAAYVVDLDNFDDRFGHNASYRIHRDRKMGRHLHTHRGFEELFIVESGNAVHDLNGRDYPLSVGDLVFVMTDDVHRFRKPSSDFAIVNFSMPVGTVSGMHRRYQLTGPAPWHRDDRCCRLADVQASRLLALTRSLRTGLPTQLAVDRFLIELMATISPSAHHGYSLPSWLAAALDRWADDDIARLDGMSGLARLAGRSREHVSRVLRDSTGKRGADVLNEIRVQIAGELLQMTDLPIAYIANHVGLPNLSNFYRVFRDDTGTTPRRFRFEQRLGTGAVL